MSKTLILTSVAGVVLCAGFLGLARAIGGDDIFHDTRTMGEMKPLVDLATQKAWRWNGGDTLALDAPINIRYQPQPSPSPQAPDAPQAPSVPQVPQVSVTGPAEVLQHMRVGGGRIATDTNIPRASGRKVEAIVNVPIRKFVVNGGENLDLGEVDQPVLDLHLNGSGTVTGHGRVDQLNLVIAGSSKAKLGGLSVTGDANISILGSGDASLSPHGRVKLFIAGSGNLQLLTKPSELRQTIVGSGEATQLSGEAAKAALKSVDVSRIASESANNAIRSALGNGGIGEIAAEAARQGIESAEIDRHVREGIARGLSQAAIDPNSGSVTVRDYKDVDLGHVERESLNVTVASSGSLTAEGKVDRLTINVMGSGHANLGKLAARSVRVMVMGSGSATVAPSEDLNAQIMGSGDVHLVTRPARMERSIMGSGRVIGEH